MMVRECTKKNLIIQFAIRIFWYISHVLTLTDMSRSGRSEEIPLRVICDWLCTIQWKRWLRDYERVIKLLCMLLAIRLTEKDHNRIDHIIINSLYKVTRMWPVTGFSSDIPRRNQSCEFEPRSWRGVLDTTLCDTNCRWFPQGTPVSSTNKTDRHNITEILLKVASNKIHDTIY
jgi:hypothetical protein